MWYILYTTLIETELGTLYALAKYSELGPAHPSKGRGCVREIDTFDSVSMQ